MAMRIFLGAMVVVSSMTMSAVAWAQAKQDFTLVNKTGYALSEVYVAPSKSDDWDQDVMGRDIVDDGEAVDISFDHADKSCKLDLKVIYQDETRAPSGTASTCAQCRRSPSSTTARATPPPPLSTERRLTPRSARSPDQRGAAPISAALPYRCNTCDAMPSASNHSL